jgi:hypothetical protein
MFVKWEISENEYFTPYSFIPMRFRAAILPMAGCFDGAFAQSCDFIYVNVN